AKAGEVAYQGMGLVFWADRDHFVRLERARTNKLNSANFLFYSVFTDGRENARGGKHLAGNSVTLKLVRQGDKLMASIRDDAGQTELPPVDISSWPEKAQVGVLAVSNCNKRCSARFRSFKLRAGEP